MNILIVHNYYKIPGGEDTVVANEKKMLEDHGHKVILYTRSNSELDKMSKLQKPGLVFTTIYNPQTVKDIKRIIKAESVDIVHVHNTLNLISPSVYYTAIKCGIPVVQTIHNFRLECMGACFYRDGQICEDCLSMGNKCALKHACYRKSKVQTLACLLSNWYHRTTGIYKKINYISLTEFNKEKLLLWKHNGKQIINEKQIFIKPNFTPYVDIENIPKTNEDYYLYIGRVEEIKGIGVILNAFEKLPDRKLRIAGQGTDFEKYKKIAEEKKLGNVEFLGYISGEEKLKQMYNAKATIVASQWYETFGMIIAESYAVRTPVISGNIGNIGNIVEDEITGLKFKYNSPDSLINAIIQYEKLDRDELSGNAYNKFQKEFSCENNYFRLIEIYELARNERGYK